MQERRVNIDLSHEPNLFDIPEDHDDIDEIFTDRNSTQLIHDSNGQYPNPAEVDGEHLRSEVASPLQMQERGAKTDLSQTHHSHAESLLRSEPLISRTVKPRSVLNESELCQGLEVRASSPARTNIGRLYSQSDKSD